MALPIQQFTLNQNKGSLGVSTAVVRATSNGHIRMNDIINGANTVGETVISMTIADIAWSAPSGVYWDIRRGDDTVYRCHGNGHLNVADNRLRLEANSQQLTANCVFELSGAGDAAIVIKVKKTAGA